MRTKVTGAVVLSFMHMTYSMELEPPPAKRPKGGVCKSTYLSLFLIFYFVNIPPAETPENSNCKPVSSMPEVSLRVLLCDFLVSL